MFNRLTGDPFVDAGYAVVKELKKIFPDKKIIELIDMVSDWFIYNWNGKIDSLQLNSNITHNSKRGTEKKRQKAKQDVMAFFNKLLTYKNSKGLESCRTCGSNSRLFSAGRDIYPLSGSKAFVNFHHSHEDGLLLCSDCIIKLFFLPLAVVQMGGKIALLHLQDQKTMEYWTNKVIKSNLNQLPRGISDGILKSEFKNPKNALFDMAADLILNFDLEKRHLQLYYFTNFGSKPDCEIFTLPAPVFTYLSKVLKSCKTDWYLFLKRHYHIKKAKWDNEILEWKIKKEGKPIVDNEYKDNKNSVIEGLLEGKNLIPVFRKYYKENFLYGKQINLLLLDYYLKEVKQMDVKQLEIIKRLGNAIFEIAKNDDNNFKKYLTMIEGAGKSYQLRGVLITLIKKHYKNGNLQPLLTLEEYVNYLFPDGVYWSEVRDVLIIYLYELLHKENIQGIDVDEIELKDTEEELTEF